LPLSNGTGRFIVLMGFHLGAHQYFVRDPAQIMASIKEINPTYMFGVPRFFEKVHDGLMTKLGEQRAWIRAAVRSVLRAKGAVKTPAIRAALDRLFVGKIRRAVFGDGMRFMFCGSAPTDPAVLRFFDALGIPIYECYGVSESAILLAMNRPGHTRFGTVGKLLEGNRMRIAEDGELLVRGEAMFAGYVDSDNTGLFDADGYYHTGDLARLDGEYLVLTGRKKEIIKTSTGMRISPVEVEQAYGRIEGVDQLVAVGNGRRFIAALVTLDSAAMRAWCAQHGIAVHTDAGMAASSEVRQYVESELQVRQDRLAEYKQVKKFVIVPVPFSPESGELTPTMKLRRAVIEAKYKDEIDAMYQS
jgi:long-chain acyl-CoA synthetase